ncbi:MAG TPA: XRE family transcriptional regulator [Candidatus Corynebacterium avicola]|uniref:XRE family transcriptional regulator n=1 Tax=Candidatus Corynebacterium avicola TaxID=2838527 RepID=A0A9D1UL20_9CORY|nr:XRE family transcriptional regulator [Candidatus Corynebacterium avicola]
MPADTQRAFGAAVRSRRAELGITLQQLAETTGISGGALSRIERGALNTSLQNAVAIASALGTELNDLLDAGDALTVTRRSEAREFVDPESGVVRTMLGRPSPGVELIRYALPGHSVTPEFAPHKARTVETIHLLTGRVGIFAEAEEVATLDAGDTAQVPGDRHHHLENPGPTEATLILLIASPR